MGSVFGMRERTGETMQPTGRDGELRQGILRHGNLREVDPREVHPREVKPRAGNPSGAEPCDGHSCRRAVLDGGGRRRAASGQRLCPLCAGRLLAGIRELPRLYAECEEALSGVVATGLREKTSSGGPARGLALNGFAAEARTQILATLGSWSGLVAQERGFAAPARQAPALADFLLSSLPWLACHPAVGDLSEEVARTVSTARRAARPDAVKKVVVGACVVPRCEGELSATVRSSRAGEGTHVRCGANPAHSWAGHEWTRLCREMQKSAPAAEERWLAAGDISRLWNTPAGTVYRLASEQSWRRISRSGRTYYAEKDVHGSFSRRKARATSTASSSL